MTLAPHQPKIVVGVLVAVLHLDGIARQLGLACSREVALIVLACVGAARRPMCRRLSRLPSRSAAHGVPLLMRGTCPPRRPDAHLRWLGRRCKRGKMGASP